MPATSSITFTGQKLTPAYKADDSFELPFNLPASATILKGTVVGEVAAALGSVKAYASGNVDGSQIPIGLMVYDVISDASGNISYGAQAATEFGQTSKDCPVYVSGVFFTKDLIGLDANAVAKLGRLICGTIADGVLALI